MITHEKFHSLYGRLSSQNVYSIIGSKGSVSFPENRIWSYTNNNGSWSEKLNVSEKEPVDSTPPFTYQLQHFVKVCQGEELPQCDGLDALKTIFTIEAIHKSIKTQLPVKVCTD